MAILREPLKVETLQQMAATRFGDLVKAVVDIERECIAVDAELHADLEALLLQDGSQQKHLWGINLYPEFLGSDPFIEFDSLINIRPSQGNRSREVTDHAIRATIARVVTRWIAR